MKFTTLNTANIGDIPKTSGVYQFKRGREMLYIGKAGNLRERVKTHFTQPSYRDNLFMEQVNKVGYIETDSEIEALLLESLLIKEKSPKYNVMWKDGKGYFFVGISGDELPRVFLTHQSQAEAQKSQIPNPKSQTNSKFIGPFTDGRAVKRTLRSLRRVFPYYTAKKHGPRSCQYCNLGLCPGPNPDKEEYRKNLKNLTALLRGKKPTVLKKLEREMRLASKNQHYEKAKALRDQLQDLEIIFSHAKVLRPAEEKQSIDWRAVETYLRRVLGTKQKISRVEAYDISNIQGKEATGSMPVFIDGKPTKEHYRKFRVRAAGKPNDFAMLEEVLTRRLKHTEWAYPDLMIIDGGRGQLSAALRAAGDSKLGRFQIVAIAKRNNELFIAGEKKPLLLRNMPQEVSNFILHIRDEAHRFAIGYHRTLRRVDLLGKSR